MRRLASTKNYIPNVLLRMNISWTRYLYGMKVERQREIQRTKETIRIKYASINAGKQTLRYSADIDGNGLDFDRIVRFCSAKRNNGRPRVFVEATDWIDIHRVVCSLQFHKSFYRDKVRISRDFSFGQFQLQSVLELARRFPPERRKTHRTKIHDGWETISATIIPFESLSSAIASAARRHCLYHRFKAFHPSLSALVFHRLEATLSACARPRFLPLRDVSKVTLEFIVTGGKTTRKRRFRLPVDWIQSELLRLCERK